MKSGEEMQFFCIEDKETGKNNIYQERLFILKEKSL